MKTAPLIIASFILTLIVWLTISFLLIYYPESMMALSVTYMMYGATTVATLYLYTKLKFAYSSINRILFSIGLLIVNIFVAVLCFILSFKADFPSWIIVFHLPLYLLYLLTIFISLNRVGELLNEKRTLECLRT